ncbi:MAG TPA: reverse transcriptase domain-containing protein [Nostocaceae cyanobacterium]|nr:reverse transcriptase domain-containing protein [Nostocaceae cyanobacterium]
MQYLERNPLQIVEVFRQIKSFQDLVDLLEVDYDWFKEQLFEVPLEEKYTSFNIPKKNGEIRKIYSPTWGISSIQERLNEVLRLVYTPKASVHGFVIERNIVTNAQNHCKKKFVLNIDIKDFFPTITQKRIRGVLMSPPYNLPSKVATTISHICCYDGKLPQGAPTSPIISNMVCAKLDSQLRILAEKNRCFYTRYADDITFSTTVDKFPLSIAKITGSKITDVILSNYLISIFESNGFQINFNKVRIQRENQRQEVTGLTVNNQLNVSRKYIRQVRAMLHDWHKNGYIQAYINDSAIRYQQNKKAAQFASALRGKIEFIGQVRQKNDFIYKKLLNFYETLIERENIRRRSLKFDDQDYNNWCIVVDQYVNEIIINYIDSISTEVDNVIECIQKGFNELGKLRQGQDPNYDLPGVPVAYAFQYLPRKIIAMTAVLSHYFREENVPVPNRILDVGSGTDAVSIALGLFRQTMPFQITAIEPCSYMRRFAMFRPNLPNLHISNVPGLLGTWFYDLNNNYYNLICMSSILQNSFKKFPDSWWLKWTNDLYKASTNNARLILIEPHSKGELIKKMKWSMESSGWRLKEELLLSDLFPNIANKKRELQQLTLLKQQLIGSYWRYSVESWNINTKYNEFIQIYWKTN